jgi:hypothetical protein
MEVPNCEELDSACFRERPPNSKIEIPSTSWGWDTSDLPTIWPTVSHDDLCAVNSTVTVPVRRQRRARVPCAIPQLSEGSSDDISEYEMKKEDDKKIGDGDMSGVKHVY